MAIDNYVYKKELDWPLFQEEITLLFNNKHIVFPNYHSLIHGTNLAFDRCTLLYI